MSSAIGYVFSTVVSYVAPYIWAQEEIKISFPPRPTETDSVSLKQYKGKIAHIQKKSDVMGIAFATYNDRLNPVYVKATKLDDKRHEMSVHSLTHDSLCGTVRAEKSDDAITIFYEENFTRFKDIHLVLVKAVIQKFQKEEIVCGPYGMKGLEKKELGFVLKDEKWILPEEARSLWLKEITEFPIELPHQ
jgi:hypothetical protein